MNFKDFFFKTIKENNSNRIGPLYHGTSQKGLTEFFGGWWSDNKETPKEFGRYIYTAYLNGPLADGDSLRELYIKFNGSDVNPDDDFDDHMSDQELADLAMSGGPFSRFVRSSGYKGIGVWDDSNLVSGMAYSVFDPDDVILINR